MTMSTVGYGDITPKNTDEIILCIFTMIFASGTFGYAIGNIQSTFNEFLAEENILANKLFVINNEAFLREYSIKKYVFNSPAICLYEAIIELIIYFF